MLNLRISIRSLRKEFLLCCIAALLVMALASPATAQQPAPAPIVLHAARLLQVETGNVLQPGEILIEGERIKAVGSAVDHPRARRSSTSATPRCYPA